MLTKVRLSIEEIAGGSQGMASGDPLYLDNQA